MKSFTTPGWYGTVLLSETMYSGDIIKLVKEGNLQQVKKIVGMKKDVLETKDANGKTLLHFAAENGQIEILQYLLGQNIQVDALTKVQTTSLHFAAFKNKLKAVRVLIAAFLMFE